jgi:RNA polymerase sigma factor (sigma-70 family)
MSAVPTRSASFPVTRWTLIASARDASGDPSCKRALEEICKAYWYPLYGFARGRGASPADAEDLTQGFFANILSADFFGRANADRGKLRSYLLGSFTNFMLNAHRDGQRLKRGGGVSFVSIDRELAEGRLQQELASTGSLEQDYEKRWALSVVAASMSALEVSCEDRGKSKHFQVLRSFLQGDDDDQSYARAAGELEMPLPTVRQEVYRLRIKLRDLMQATIADTLQAPTEAAIEAELAELKRVLRG